MTRFKKILLPAVMVLSLGATTVTAFAASPATPSGLDASSLQEIKAQRLELKKEILADRVEAGLLTQEQADEITAQIQERQATCDGTGSDRIGQMMGAGFGSNGQGKGQGLGQGNGLGMGQGCR